MSNAIITTLGQLAIGTAGVAPNRRIDFANFQVGVGLQVVDGNRNRGKMDRNINRVRTVRKMVQPQLSMPSPTTFELALILPWLTGGTPVVTGSSTFYPWSNSAPEQSLAYHDGQASPKIHTYYYNAIRTASFQSSDADPTLSVNLGLIGRHYDDTLSWPSLTPPYDQVDITKQPLVHTDTAGAVLVNSVAVPTRSISLTIEKNIPDRYLNSLTQTANFQVDRNYRLALAFPLGEAPALYTAGQAGVPVTLTYTNGSSSLTITMPLVQFPEQPIELPMREEVYHVLNGVCYESADGTLPAVRFDLVP